MQGLCPRKRHEAAGSHTCIDVSQDHLPFVGVPDICLTRWRDDVVGISQVSEEEFREALRQSQQQEAQLPPPNTVQVLHRGRLTSPT